MTDTQTIKVEFDVPMDEALAGVWDYARASLVATVGTKCTKYIEEVEIDND